MKASECVKFKLEGGVGWITLNRPEVLNALDMEVITALSGLLDSIGRDENVRAVVITGAGEKAFCAGADIRYMNQASPLEVRKFAQLAISVNNRIETLGKVVVAAINGYALGGGLELAESCTLRVAVKHAELGHPEVSIGAVAGWGGTTRLPRLIGKGRAAELLLTGDRISAQECYKIGLINRVCEKDMLQEETKALLNNILAKAPLAVRMSWEAVHRGLNMTLEESVLLGADYFGLIASSEDFREGTAAFLEKRSPAYKNR
ncbi:MAG: enoyl-CoA hydratase/isomerase family protein [Nitrospirae bacterium]|nr:enoyl-CoA hydratase/isomerase family protein [Nitrospirota bacterium]